MYFAQDITVNDGAAGDRLGALSEMEKYGKQWRGMVRIPGTLTERGA